MNIKQAVLLITGAFILTSCANTQYVDQMVEIEQARQAGRITVAEYLQLKGQAQIAYETEAKGTGPLRRALDRRAAETAIQERMNQTPLP